MSRRSRPRTLAGGGEETRCKMDEAVTYVGKDLEAMSYAVNYHRWILEIFKPYLKTRLVEVGAGTGSFSELLLADDSTESLSVVEPSTAMFAKLRRHVAGLNPVPPVSFYNALFADVAPEIKAAQRPDSIIYVNVLEHIGDDAAELRAVYDTLDSGGRLFIFVPALESLFGKFDEKIGHYRRYRKPELTGKCQAAGFKILKAVYFDLTGAVLWWLKYRLLRSETLDHRSVLLYDKYALPAVKACESMVTPPVGKNVLLVAEKP